MCFPLNATEQTKSAWYPLAPDGCTRGVWVAAAISHTHWGSRTHLHCITALAYPSFQITAYTMLSLKKLGTEKMSPLQLCKIVQHITHRPSKLIPFKKGLRRPRRSASNRAQAVQSLPSVSSTKSEQDLSKRPRESSKFWSRSARVRETADTRCSNLGLRRCRTHRSGVSVAAGSSYLQRTSPCLTSSHGGFAAAACEIHCSM